MKKILLILLLGMAGQLAAVTIKSTYQPRVSSTLQQGLAQPMVTVGVTNGVATTQTAPQVLQENLLQPLINTQEFVSDVAAPTVNRVVLPSEYAAGASGNVIQTLTGGSGNLSSVGGGGAAAASGYGVASSSSTGGTSAVRRVTARAAWTDRTTPGSGSFVDYDYVPGDVGSGVVTPPQPPYAIVDGDEPMTDENVVPVGEMAYWWMALLLMVYVGFKQHQGGFAIHK